VQNPLPTCTGCCQIIAKVPWVVVKSRSDDNVKNNIVGNTFRVIFFNNKNIGNQSESTRV